MSDYSTTAASAFECVITPRYTDLDTWRHVNNSRIYQLHLEARLQAHLAIFGPDAWFSDSARMRPVRSITNYRQVTWFGSDVTARVSVLGCDADSYRVRSELFQNDLLVGTQDCIIGAFERGRRCPMPSSILEGIRQKVAVETRDPLAAADYRRLFEHTGNLPVQQELTMRYGELDADSQRSEAALARYMEQARFGGIRRLDMGGLGILIASADISFEHYVPGWQPVELASGISRIGNSSFVVSGCARFKGELQACANSVMVVIDPKTNRPVPITAELREQLQQWAI